MAENNLIHKSDLARVREVDFTLQFTESLKKLCEALGVTRRIPKQAGAALKTYRATGSLSQGDVGEGETIPLSKYAVEAETYGEIAMGKWRKATSAEAIIDRGFDQAVGMTTDRMLRDVQKKVRGDFFAFLATGTAKASGTGLQAALANGWGTLQTLFQDDEIETVYFLNPMDAAAYMGTAQISTQQAFGMTYIESFLGLGTVFLTTAVPAGTYYATAKDNIVLYYVPVGGADLGEAFRFTAVETGLIGVHEEPNYENMTASDTVVCGLTLLAERPDGIVVGTIGAEG